MLVGVLNAVPVGDGAAGELLVDTSSSLCAVVRVPAGLAGSDRGMLSLGSA